jgi:hypothetical protein
MTQEAEMTTRQTCQMPIRTPHGLDRCGRSLITSFHSKMFTLTLPCSTKANAACICARHAGATCTTVNLEGLMCRVSFCTALAK